jgi:hypothetical protein
MNFCENSSLVAPPEGAWGRGGETLRELCGPLQQRMITPGTIPVPPQHPGRCLVHSGPSLTSSFVLEDDFRPKDCPNHLSWGLHCFWFEILESLVDPLNVPGDPPLRRHGSTMARTKLDMHKPRLSREPVLWRLPIDSTTSKPVSQAAVAVSSHITKKKKKKKKENKKEKVCFCF